MILGYTHESFWDQTPATVRLTMEAATERRTLEHNDRAWLAWHIAALQRATRLPGLDRLKAKKQTAPEHWEKQLADLKSWVIATGGKVIVKSQDN